jgi:hypothetical protein
MEFVTIFAPGSIKFAMEIVGCNCLTCVLPLFERKSADDTFFDVFGSWSIDTSILFLNNAAFTSPARNINVFF